MSARGCCSWSLLGVREPLSWPCTGTSGPGPLWRKARPLGLQSVDGASANLFRYQCGIAHRAEGVEEQPFYRQVVTRGKSGHTQRTQVEELRLRRCLHQDLVDGIGR